MNSDSILVSTMLIVICLLLLCDHGRAYSVPDHRDDQVSVLRPQVPTNWGIWGKKEYCEPGTYVNGFQLNVGNEEEKNDDTAVNTLLLFCNG